MRTRLSQTTRASRPNSGARGAATGGATEGAAGGGADGGGGGPASGPLPASSGRRRTLTPRRCNVPPSPTQRFPRHAAPPSGRHEGGVRRSRSPRTGDRRPYDVAMLLVLGVRHLHAVLASGQFHCPACGGDRAYRLLGPRAWFHLFWLPLVPLRRGAPFVECGACRGRFLPATLAVPTAERLAELLSRAVRTAAGHLLAAQPPAPGDLRRALAVLQRSQGSAYTRDVLVADLAAHREGSDLSVVAELAGAL